MNVYRIHHAPCLKKNHSIKTVYFLKKKSECQFCFDIFRAKGIRNVFRLCFFCLVYFKFKKPKD